MEGTNDAIEEERRLCYVAITRAKKRLWIINTKRRLLYGQTQSNPPSRFIDEIDSKYLDIEKQTTSIIDKVSKFKKEKMYTSENIDFQVGDTINHTDYGEGVITAVDKKIITVAFPFPLGIKKFIKNHKSITKV